MPSRSSPLRRAAAIAAGGALAVLAAKRMARWLQRYRSTGPLVAPEAPEFLKWSACRLAKAIRSGELRSSEVVEAAIRVLEATTALNALAWERFGEARREARAADERVEEAARAGRLDELPAFFGLPVVLKEAFEYTGKQYSHGLLARKGTLGARKGPVVRRVEEAGFIVVATGNISEATMWMESYNRVYGRSNSPFDLSCTPGGSSGGTAAAVAVLGSPVGMSADIGGSTRIPAFFCGLFGHKATGGLVPNTGTHLDNCTGPVCRICQLGTVTRHAEDLLPMLKVIAGPPSKEEDPKADEYLPLPNWTTPSGPDKPRLDLTKLSVIPLTFKGGMPGKPLEVLLSSVSAPIREGQARVVEHLRSQGATIKPMYFEDLDVGDWFATWADRNQAAGGPSFRRVICEDRPVFGIFEIVRYLVGVSKHTMPALLLSFVEDLVDLVSPPQKKRLANAAAVEAKIEAALTDAHGRDSVIIMPTLPRHGCRHDELLLRTFDSSFTCIWNATEFPATAVPLGLADGLPFGLQIVSTRGNDELTLGVAMELERAGLAKCVAPGSA